MSADVHIGTSGWYYPDWIGRFYPDGLPMKQLLPHYARHFSTVELNASFYRLPFVNTVKGWHEKAPKGFLYAVKGNRRITHLKKLADVDEELKTFFQRISGLGEHLGPVLWQLPPSLHRDDALLDHFLGGLPREFHHAVEFRHVSWFHSEVFQTLSRHRAALVSISSQRMPMELSVTTDFAYLRFHGLQGGCAHDYTREELAPWADHIRKCLAADRRVFAYFNNDAGARAVRNAQDLLQLVAEPTRRK
jgi:uncharacterized protein YecE (DUF72 family)